MPPITSFLKYKEKANSELHKETARDAHFLMAGHVLGMIGQLVDPDDLRDKSPENVKLWNEICTIASPMWKDDGKGNTFCITRGTAKLEKKKQQLEWEKNAKNLNKVVNLITDNFESVCRESFANADSSSWLNNSSIAYFIYKGLPRLCNFFELDVHFLPDELAKTYNKVAQEKNKPLLWDVPAEDRVPFVPNAGAKDKADPEVKKETWKPRNQFAKVIAGVENEMDMVGMDHRDIERARSIREKVNPIYYNDKKILKGLEASFADITAKHRVTGAGGSTTKHDNMKKSITDVMKMLRNNREHPVSLSQKLRVLEKARDMTDIYIAAKTEGHENDPTWEPTSQMGKRRLKGARKALAILNEEIEHLKLFKAGLVQPEVSYNEFLTASEASKIAPDADKKSFAEDHLFIGTALDSEIVVSKEKLKAVRGYKPAKKAEAKKGMDYREWCRKFPKEPKDVDEEELSPIQKMDLDKYNDMRRIKNFSAYFGGLPVSMMIQNGSKNIASKLTLTMDCIASMFYAKDEYEELFDESDEFKTPEEEWNAGLKHFKDLKDILTEGDNFNEVMKGIEQADEFSKAPGMNFKQQFFDYLEFVNLNFGTEIPYDDLMEKYEKPKNAPAKAEEPVKAEEPKKAEEPVKADEPQKEEPKQQMTHEEKLSAELKPRLEVLDQVVNKEFVKGNMDLLNSMKKYNKALTEVIAIRILADSKKIEIGGKDWDNEVAFQAKTVRDSDAYVKMLDPVKTERFKELAEMAKSGDIKNEYVKFVSSAKKEHQEPAMPKAAEKTTSASGVGMKK